MAYEFKLPDIGEGLVEGEIVKWLDAAGDTVGEDEPMVEVMTDKATVELPAPVAGTVSELRATEGQVVPVGDVIIVIQEEGAPAKPAAAPEPPPAPEAAKAPVATAPPASTRQQRTFSPTMPLPPSAG